MRLAPRPKRCVRIEVSRSAIGRRRARVDAGALAWIGVASVLCVAALAGAPWPADVLDWQPARFATEPWRALTAVAVHYSREHLVANLLAVALTGLFGLVAQLPARMALAWLAAWPLTHIGLLVRPELAHYGGLSGVVHAGVAVTITWLLLSGTRAQQLVTLAVLAGFVGKLVSEAPWGAVLRHPEGWGIATAPIAHTTGALAGALCASIASVAWRGRRHGAG